MSMEIGAASWAAAARQGTQGAKATGFLELVQARYAQEETQAVTGTEGMDQETYQSYIYELIDNMPKSPSQQASHIAVHISDEGFAAMQDDPAYASWVLDSLRESFLSNNPWAGDGGHYIVHTFGATREEYHGESWYDEFEGGTGAQRYADRTKDSFWESRIERHKKNMELMELVWNRRKILESQMKRRGETDESGRIVPYIAGISAAELLSIL